MPLAFSGSLSGSLNIVGPLVGNSVTSSYPIDVLDTTLYSTAPAAGPNFNTTNSIFLGFQAGIGATDANDSNFLGAYAGVAATNAFNSNFLGANAGYGATNAHGANFIGHQAGREATGTQEANFIGVLTGYSASNAGFSNFLGTYAGWGAVNAYQSNFLGSDAGRSATEAQYSNFIGNGAGAYATNAASAVFIGQTAGGYATNAANSIFIGQSAGAYGAEAENSVMIGNNAGYLAPSASYGVLLGYRAGYDATNTSSSIGQNNIIIGTSVTLEKDRRDSINLGGVIFATGSYFSTVGSSFSGSMLNAKVGINKSLPEYTLDVNGSGNFSSGLTATGSLTVSGSGHVFYNFEVEGNLAALSTLQIPSSINIAPATGSMYVLAAANELWIYTGNSATGWVTASLGI